MLSKDKITTRSTDQPKGWYLPFTRHPCESRQEKESPAPTDDLPDGELVVLLYHLLYFIVTAMVDQTFPPARKPYRPPKFAEATTVLNSPGGSTSQNPAHPLPKKPKVSEVPRKGKTAPKSLTDIHDKVWLFIFLIHTLAYLGVSAWINYAVIANDKQPINEDNDLGPIDVYVLDSASR